MKTNCETEFCTFLSRSCGFKKHIKYWGIDWADSRDSQLISDAYFKMFWFVI